MSAFSNLLRVMALIVVPGFSFASEIQMLPPVDDNNPGTPCAATAYDKVVTWDGANTTKCQTNFVANNGSIGIGTSAPRAMLDVNGMGYFGYLYLGTPIAHNGGAQIQIDRPNTDDQALIAFTSGGTQKGTLGLESGSDDLSLYSFYGGNIILGNGGGLTNGGNVGIGTSAPIGTLDVENGTNNASICLNGECVRSLQPTIKVETATFDFTPVAHYLDCPSGYIAIACNSVVVPSGSFTCQTTPDQIDPATNNNACAQAGCSSHATADYGYYTTTTCMKQ